MSKKIYIYAPCDGEVDLITNIKDDVFSQKMLGDGIFIKPSSHLFNSPIENGTLESVFHTKHAFLFKDEYGLNILMHIGVDTVKLDGEPFNVKSQELVNITKSTEIVDVNLDLIKSHNISTDTPIVIENLEELGFVIENVKQGKVKQGDVIVELVQKVKEIGIKQASTPKNKFEVVVEQIETAVGTIANVNDFYNCMTRFRLVIKDKSLVDAEAIKSIPLVKGVNWSGSELQVIIGGEVNIVRETWEKKFSNSKTKNKRSNQPVPFKEKALRIISGIVQPIVPLIITGGLLTSVYSILELCGLIETISLSYDVVTGVKFINSYGVFSGVLYIICKLGLGFMGLFFCYNTIKFFNGNTTIGIYLGLILTAPYLFSGLSWTLFSIGSINISVQGYTSAVIPQIGGAIIFLLLDKWIKTWMPAIIDNYFRYSIAIFITAFATFFVIGPALNFVESGLFYTLKQTENLKYGFGAFIFSILWLPLVVTGMHMGLVALVVASVDAGTPSTLFYLMYNSAVACIGIGLAMAMISKKRQTRDIGITSIVTSSLGVSEPSIYGYLLIKPKTWFAYFAGQGAFGLLVGVFNVRSFTTGAPGVLSVTTLIGKDVPITNLIFAIIANVVGIVVGFLVTFVVYQEKLSEYWNTKKLNNKIIKFVSKTDKNFKEKEIYKQFEELLITVKNNKLEFKNVYKILVAKNNCINIQEQLVEEKNFLIEKINLLNQKYLNKNKIQKVKHLDESKKLKKINSKIEKQEEKLKEIELRVAEVVKNFEKTQSNYIETVQSLLLETSKLVNYNEVIKMEAHYFNTIHAIDIYLGITKAKPNEFKIKNLNKKRNTKTALI